MKKKIVILLSLMGLLLSSCGVNQDTNQGTSEMPEETSTPSAAVTEAQQEPQESKAALDSQALLAAIPYYGDRSKCKMTAEQATAYAQVIADGIAGKIKPEGYESVNEGDLPFWEDGFETYGYGGIYKTNRANAILADFAGDGNPYLYVFSSLVDTGSFTVFGWSDNQAKEVWNYENWGGRGEACILENFEENIVQLWEGGSSGAADISSVQYNFVDGGLKEVYSRQEYYDSQTETMHIVENGVDTAYTMEQYYALEHEDGEGVQLERTMPYPSLDEVAAKPATLRDMMEALNHYAKA